jgi:hypothetical protein
LLENYSAVYPDKEKELFFGSKYGYFYSPVYVNPAARSIVCFPMARSANMARSI